MKPEPLKNKKDDLSRLFGKYKIVYNEEDVKSAVKWLKQNISGETITIQNIRKKIDEAFEDIIR